MSISLKEFGTCVEHLPNILGQIMTIFLAVRVLLKSYLACIAELQLNSTREWCNYVSHSYLSISSLDSLDSVTIDLLEQLLTLNPVHRITAAKALDHDYFWTDPLPADPKS